MGLESGLAALNGDEQAAETSCVSLVCSRLETVERDDVLLDENIGSAVMISQQRDRDVEARINRFK